MSEPDIRQADKSFKTKRAVLIAVGAIIGGFFLYLTFRDISRAELTAGLSQMQLVYLLPAAALVCVVQFIRALRFGLIIAPFCSLTVHQLWDLLNIWAAANMILPARLAEFVRPYLLRQKGASFSSGLGAMMIERFFDLSGLLFLIGLVLWGTPDLPNVYFRLGLFLMIGLLTGYAIIVFTLVKREIFERLLGRVLAFLPARAAEFIARFLHKLLDGFGIMASPWRVCLGFAYSVCLWLLFSLITYVFLRGFTIEAPFLTAVTTQVFIAFGVAIPSAPGFIGTFHAAARYSLTLFGIQAGAAVSFALVYHLFSLVLCVLMGLISYAGKNFTFDYHVLTKPPQPDEESTPVAAKLPS